MGEHLPAARLTRCLIITCCSGVHMLCSARLTDKLRKWRRHSSSQFQQTRRDSDPDQRACLQSALSNLAWLSIYFNNCSHKQSWRSMKLIFRSPPPPPPSPRLLRQHLDLNDSTDSHRDGIHFWTLSLWMVWRRKCGKWPSVTPAGSVLHNVSSDRRQRLMWSCQVLFASYKHTLDFNL